jgi:hypothetical protein
MEQMLTDEQIKHLCLLKKNAMWASSAWLQAGLTEKLQELQERGYVACRNREGVSADPLDIDDGVYWAITEAGREALGAK